MLNQLKPRRRSVSQDAEAICANAWLNRMWQLIKTKCRYFKDIPESYHERYLKDLRESSKSAWVRQTADKDIIIQWNEFLIRDKENIKNFGRGVKPITADQLTDRTSGIKDMILRYIEREKLNKNGQIYPFNDISDNALLSQLSNSFKGKTHRDAVPYMHNGKCQCSSIACYALTSMMYGTDKELIENQNLLTMVKYFRWILYQTLIKKYGKKILRKFWDYAFKFMEVYYYEFAGRPIGEFGCSIALFRSHTKVSKLKTKSMLYYVMFFYILQFC